MKKVLITAMICVTLVVCTFMLTCMPAGADVLKGDMDGNGVVNINDVLVLLKQVTAPKPTATPTSTPTPTPVPSSEYFTEGNGTEEAPFMIYTAEELFKMAELVNNGETDESDELYSTKAYKLGADIEISDENFEFMPDTGLIKVTDGTNIGYLGTGILGDDSGDNTVFDTWESELNVWYNSPESDTVGTYSGEFDLWTPIGKGGYIAVPYEITDSSTFNLAMQKYGMLYYYSGSYYSSAYYYTSSYSQYYYEASFKGSFDGDGHKISGVLTNTNEAYQGLFGYVAGGTISNVTLENSYIRGGSYVGGIAGYCSGTISNCTNSGNVIGSGNSVGGIAGSCGSTTTISDCVNSGNVSGSDDYVGGIAGFCFNYNGTTTITDCTNSGDVSGSDDYVGGIAGSCNGTIGDCKNSGYVNGNNYVGGIMGKCDSYNSTTTITNCSNNGNVSGSVFFVGGIAGWCYNGTISNCSNSGDVSGGKFVGGIAGNCYYGTISNCANSGTISGIGYVGGIAGECGGTETNKTTIEKCYSVNGTLKDIAIGAINATNNFVRSRYVYILDTEATDDMTNGGTLLTDEQMREQSSFAGFDFDTVWTMAGDTSYPYPELQALVK